MTQTFSNRNLPAWAAETAAGEFLCLIYATNKTEARLLARRHLKKNLPTGTRLRPIPERGKFHG